MIDLYASHPHYADHLAPIWAALPEHVRGKAWAHTINCWWGTRRNLRAPLLDQVVLVASYTDARTLYPRPCIYVEHGAGQTYRGLPAGTEGHYSGGEQGNANIIGWIAPSEAVAARWPGPSAAVGCPRLDAWHGHPAPTERVVALTWHWNCRLVPETRPAFHHYQPELGGIIERWRIAGWEVLGHHHPRDDRMRHHWRKLRVTSIASVTEVMDRARILLADNTSLLYEFAALDRPVVALNAPWYRRDVDHGMRFWDQVPGVMIDTPSQLRRLDLDWMVAADPYADMRRRVVGQVYAAVDGRAAERAAEFICQLIGASHAQPVRLTPQPDDRPAAHAPAGE